jgi:hypothetical protein
MLRGEMLGAAIHERYEIRSDATKFVAITHLRSRKGWAKWGRKITDWEGPTCLHEVCGLWRIGREYIRMTWDVYVRSTAICKKTGLECGSRFVDVDGSGASSILLRLPRIDRTDRRKRIFRHIFAATHRAFAGDKNARFDP